MNSSFGVVVLVTLLSLRTIATADVCSDTYQRGLDAFKAEDYASARSEFVHAYDLCRKPRILYAVAQTYRFELRLEPALAYYNYFLAQSKDARKPSDDELLEKTQGYVARLEADLGALAQCTVSEDEQKLQAAVMVLFHLAECHEKLGELATAWKLFQDAAQQTRSASNATSRNLHDIAQARVHELQPRISRLTISVPSRRQFVGLEITRGSEPVDAGSWNQPLPIDGGHYTITASAPGAKSWSSQITVATERDTKTVEVPDLRELGDSAALVMPEVDERANPPARPIAPVTGHDPESQDGSRTVVPLVIGSGALALLGGGLGLELVARWRYDEAKAEMTSQTRRDSLYNSANTTRAIAAASALSGLAAGGVAVWQYLRARRHEHVKASHVSLYIVPMSAGAAAAGQF